MFSNLPPSSGSRPRHDIAWTAKDATRLVRPRRRHRSCASPVRDTRREIPSISQRAAVGIAQAGQRLKNARCVRRTRTRTQLIHLPSRSRRRGRRICPDAWTPRFRLSAYTPSHKPRGMGRALTRHGSANLTINMYVNSPNPPHRYLANCPGPRQPSRLAMTSQSTYPSHRAPSFVHAPRRPRSRTVRVLAVPCRDSDLGVRS